MNEFDVSWLVVSGLLISIIFLIARLIIIQKNNQLLQVESHQQSVKVAQLEQSTQHLLEQVKTEQKNQRYWQQQYQEVSLSQKQQQLEFVQLKTSLQKERLFHQEKLELMEKNKEQLKKEFENLAQAIFDQKSQQFNVQNQQQIGGLLDPFKQQIQTFSARVDAIHSQESMQRSELHNELKNLHKLNQNITQEAANLTKALIGQKKTQGNWGEMILETVLEQSGLVKGREYQREVSLKDREGNLFRPDVVINLPQEKQIVVDAKVSLVAYTDYVNAVDEHEKKNALLRHIDAIKHHIDTLCAKNYQKLTAINSPDFVFLFMPVEPAFILALEQDQQLLTKAFESKIVLVSPTTLLASLRTVGGLWNLEKQNNSAKELAQHASKVYEKFRGFVETVEKMGGQISTLNKSYDEMFNKLTTGRGNLVSMAAKFEKFGVTVNKPLPKAVTDLAQLDE